MTCSSRWPQPVLADRSWLSRPVSVTQAVNAVLVLAVLFPFLPRIVASTDTQPTFLLAFALTIGVSIAAPTVAGKLYRISLPGITALLLGGFVLYASLVAANAMQAEATIAGRLVSFLQFCAAALLGYAG